LTLFLILGGLGLLIGIASFVIVVRKDLVARTEQIKLLRAIGFSDDRISRLLKAESRITPVSAIVLGVAASLAAIVDGMMNVSRSVWLTTLVFIVLLLTGVWFFIDKSVENSIEKTKQL
jgi:putative ABC transport system permease protein